MRCNHCGGEARVTRIVHSRWFYECNCGRVYLVKDITAIYDEYEDAADIPDDPPVKDQPSIGPDVPGGGAP
jgi:hypothetical protein